MSRDPFLNQSLDGGSAQVPQLQAGQRLFNQCYELVRPLGAGGMGVVWLARDHTEETDVALKFVPSVLVLQDSEMRRLREEVRAGKELRHSRLVATYGLEVEGGVAAIAMEYVSGQTLKEKLEAHERGFFEPEELAAWVQDICAGLAYLHEEARRIHRDLKPANIIVDGAGHARLMDFGISHRIKEGVTRHSKTSDSAAGGGSSSTLAYACPQQLSGKPGDKVDDIYSLGATLYELLTGTPPFFRGDAELVRGQIKHEPVTPIHERRVELVAEGLNATAGQDVSAAVEAMVQACMAKNREDRPQSASQVAPSFAPAAPPLQASVVKSVPHHKENQSVEVKGRPPETSVRRGGRGSFLWLHLALLAAAALGAWGMLSKPKENVKRTRLPDGAPFTNGLGMKFVPVSIDGGPSQGERVLFSIWETRGKDYAAFIQAGSWRDNKEWRTAELLGVAVGRGPGENAEESDHPVVNVTHHEAEAFCEWLTQKERTTGWIGPKDVYRLPTDAEWSYAAGIGDEEDVYMSPRRKDMQVRGKYPWDSTYPPPALSGNYSDTTAKANFGGEWDAIPGYTDGYATTAPGGRFRPNALGLYDMGGNLAEWTSSLYDPEGRDFVLRGGSWNVFGSTTLLTSARVISTPEVRTISYGFRCVLVMASGR